MLGSLQPVSFKKQFTKLDHNCIEWQFFWLFNPCLKNYLCSGFKDVDDTLSTKFTWLNRRLLVTCSIMFKGVPQVD